jgi:hypothetical protein
MAKGMHARIIKPDGIWYYNFRKVPNEFIIQSIMFFPYCSKYMALLTKKNLILVEAKEIKFLDKQTGKEITKWKYTFLQEDGNLVIGYLPTADYKGEVQDVEGWDGSKAKAFVFAPKLFEGVTTYVLQPKSK